MGLAISRVDMLENQTDSVIHIKQVLHPLSGDRYADIITLPPRETKEVGATEFAARSRYSGRSSHLEVFVDGKETGVSFTPSTFLDFSKIILRLDGSQFIISGIRAQLTDLRRIRCFGFMGRDYPGRPQEIISKTMLPGSFNV